MKYFIIILTLLGSILSTQQAGARDLVLSRSLIEDPSGKLTIADIAHLEGQPIGPSLSLGSSRTVHWFRVQVQAPALGSQVVLHIRPSFLNEVRLYEADPGDPLKWKTRVTGNHYPYLQRDRSSISLGFVVDVTAPVATYYLRIKTRSPIGLDLEALTPEDALRKDQNRDLLMVFFVTAMGFLLFWAIHSYFLDRQPVLGIFAIHQAVYTLFSISTTGYLAPIMPANLPQLADWFNMILYCSISFTPVLFCRALFKPYAPPPLLMRGLQVLLWSFPVLLLLIALGYDALAVNTCAVLIRISWLYFVGMAFSLRKESTPSRRILQGFFVVILINNLVFWYVNRIGWMAVLVNPSAMQILVVDGLVIGGLFAIILHSRTRQVLREGQQSALELLLVQKKFEIEQELKKRIEVQAQTDYLTGVCNRRRFVELAEHELARANRFQRPFTLLVIDIDHFKSINDTWGHGVGDKVLKEITIRMSGALREADIFGRTGGEEFAAVLVEIEGQDAIEVAQRLCASVAASWIDLPEARGIHASVSIGLAQLNGRDVSFNHLLQEADGAMYSAKQAGRNQVFAEV